MTTVRCLLFAALALGSRAAAADCAITGLQTSVITKQDAEIVGSGGLLVAATPVMRDTQEKSPGMQPGWRVRAGGTLIAPEIDTIAPGLFVYRVDVTRQATPIEIENEAHELVGKVIGSKAKVADYPAPKVSKLAYSKDGSRHFFERITATLDAAPPAGTFALALADAKGKVLSWAPVIAGANTQDAFLHRDCQVLPDGMSAARPGAMVTLFWVSTEGRISQRSQPIKVGGKPNPY